MVFNKMMFNKKTQARVLWKIFETTFEGHIGRSHFIKMNKGSHFSYHRA